MQAQNNISTYKIDWRIINWMRGLAALYVVVNHSRGLMFTNAMKYAQNIAPKSAWHWWEWLNFLLMQHTNLGPEFVILFFILSGFSIAHSISNNNDTAGFYIRRLIRLYPPYMLGIVWAILVFVIIKIAAPDVFNHGTEGHIALSIPFHKFDNFSNLVLNFIYVPKNNFLTPQYWSLPYEIIFYLLAPFIIKHFRWYGVATIAAYAIGCMLMGYQYVDDEHNHIPRQFLTDYNIYFLIGILFYMQRDRLLANFRLNKLLSLVSLLVIFESLVIAKSYLFHQDPNKLTGLGMILFTFILLSAGLKYKIRIPWLERIGVFSYTLYVTHYASIYLLKLIFYKLGLHFYEIYILYGWYLGIGIAVGMAALLYYAAEYPGITYLEKLRNKKLKLSA